MATESKIWITGDARSGKTSHLIGKIKAWVKQEQSPSAIIFAANHTTGRQFTEQLMRSIESQVPFVVKTPLAFIEDEVNLFSPLWLEKLNLTPHFPLRLRSETEQKLAMALWHDHWFQEMIPNQRIESRLVRTTLDILQLAGASGTPLTDIPALLSSRLTPEEKAVFGGEENEEVFTLIGNLLMKWHDWCLERGFLTYGLIYYLYGQVLLGDPLYQEKLEYRYNPIFADDVDNYPAIAADLARLFLQGDRTAVFTFNPNGKVRFGLAADPDTWEKLASSCYPIPLTPSPPSSESPPESIDRVLEVVADPSSIPSLPPCIQHLKTISRAQLLRETAETIIKAIEEDKIIPEDIAIIFPGLDEIARYTLIRLFSSHSIAVNPLSEQRPLITSSQVRALLTLTCFVYPQLGRLLETNAVAEMLVVLTEHNPHSIDPARSGILADYCYQADPDFPRLLDIKTFSRWDRIGYQGTVAYNQLRHWIEKQKEKTPNLVSFFNQAIQQFLWKGNNLSVADLSSLRELTETTQHYWEVQNRIQEEEGIKISDSDLISEFIQLLKQGTITANPHPLPSFGESLSSGITLSNIFQYRSHRTTHRWQFWLDVGSHLWLKQGASNLFASSVFLREGNLTSDPEVETEKHLQRILRDLLSRTKEKVCLCHSDLNVNGTEQSEILLSLVHGTNPFSTEI